MTKVLLSFVMITGLTVSVAQAGQKTITCAINAKESQKLVDQKLKQNPKAKGETGDNGAILVAGLEDLELQLKNNKVVGGSIYDIESLGDDTVDLDGKGFADAGDITVEASFDAKKNQIQVSVDSRDHYGYTIQLNKNGTKGILSGSFDWDCGGDGSEVHAVMDCVIAAE